MEFLKEILGEELYKQLETAVNAYNGNEANKDKQVKLANLGGGEYVGKGKYDALDALLKGKEAELTTANGLIAELKKGTKGNEELQGKITGYETQVQQLQAELEKTKLEAAIKVELLSSKAKDVDYLAYKLNEKLKHDGETLTLDDNGAIKGWDDKLAGLKTQFPTMFETDSGNGDGYQIYQPNKLKSGDGGEPTPTKESFKTMSYEQRVALKQKNETLYKQLSK